MSERHEKETIQGRDPKKVARDYAYTAKFFRWVLAAIAIAVIGALLAP